MKAFRTLFWTELKQSFRDMNMLIFAIGFPIVILIILGIIYGTKPAFEGSTYSFVEQSFGALCTVSICAGGLMGLPITIADIREKKILKRFKVTPVSPVMILFVYLMLYVFYSTVSLILLYIIAALTMKVRITGSVVLFLGSWFLTMVSTLSIGLMVGGLAKNSKIAGVAASLLYFPMLVFSGTTLPFEVMPKTMQMIVKLFPLTQGIQLMKASFLGENMNGSIASAGCLPAILVMSMVTVVCSLIAEKCFKWE